MKNLKKKISNLLLINRNNKKVRIYVDMDGVLCDYITLYKEYKEKYNLKYPQSKKGFFKNLKPLPKSIETFKKLNEKYKVYILTRPSINNFHCYTEKIEWLNKHIGFDILKRTIISPDKGFALTGNYDNYLIDDSDKHGQLNFPGTFLKFDKNNYDWDKIANYFNLD